MVDFNKLRAEQNARMAALAGSASTVQRMRSKTHLEILQELSHVDEDGDYFHPLSEWEQGFCKSCVQYLKSSEKAKLSPKQLWCVDKMVVKYSIATQTENSNVSVSPARSSRIVLDDMDDDIPF